MCRRKLCINLFIRILFAVIIFLFYRYNVQWYVAPLRIQKMLLFLLQRGTKAFNLNLGGLFVGSLESAATVKNILRIMQKNVKQKIF